MNRSKSIQALIRKSKRDLRSLKADYEAALQDKSISEELKVDIKNIFGNLRSCLDYFARDIFEECIKGTPPKILYFPIRQTRKECDIAIDRDFPNLTSTHTDVYALLEQIQPYNDDWLGEFNKLNNNNKHQDLVEQTKIETRQVKVSSQGASVSWNPDAVTFGAGVKIAGVPMDPRTQMPVPNNQAKVEVINWVDFKFKDNGKSVCPFIEKSINNVENLFIELGKLI